MDISLLFKIAGIGVLTSVIHTILKQAGKEDQGFLATLAGVVIILAMIIPMIQQLLNSTRMVFGF